MTNETKRRPGRPRIHEGERDRIEVRIPPELRRAVLHSAIDEGLSLSEWMVDAARRKLQRPPAAATQEPAG